MVGAAVASLAMAPAWSQVVINEIMYHPASENVREEYVELWNRSATNVNLTGWKFSGGVDYAFPNGTIVNAGAYLVVSAHKASFVAKYPSVPSARVVGDWVVVRTTNVVGNVLTSFENTLSNTRNTINLRNAADDVVDTVGYADEGDWAIRQRGALDLGYRGWRWYREHDGLGKSLELINPDLPNEHGQNWSASSPAEGTPGAVNSVFSSNVAPLLVGAVHQPAVPRSTDPITIRCRVINETAAGLTVQVLWRIDSATPPAFTTTTMFDDGLHGDGLAGDGVYGASLGTQPNNAVIEYYVYARDTQGNERTWPGPAIGAPDDGSGPTGQVANALLQVDDSSQNQFGGTASMQPVYKLIMTENERAELQNIPCNGPETQRTSDAQMNVTFISLDASGTEVRHRTGVRRRGHGSRCNNPRNLHINFVSDQLWKDAVALNFNAVRPYVQHFASTLALKSGAPGSQSRAVQLRVNNVNLATTGSPMFGSYAANEVYNGEWADRQYPLDGGGNVYKVIRDIDPPNFDYRGTDPNSYTNTYYKDTNASENDWTDIMTMLSVMGENSTTLYTFENIQQVINIDAWLTHIAVMNFFANGESGFNTGNNDDYYMYRGVADPRFVLMFHDLDSVLGQSESLATTLSIFRPAQPPISGDAEGTWRAMDRFLRSPEIQPRYFAIFQRLIDTTFSEAQYNNLLDQILGPYVTSATITAMKTWMSQRRASVQSQIGGPIVWNTNQPLATISGEPRAVTPSRNATLTIGGSDITHYRYRLNNTAYSAETPVGTPITLSNLPNGSTNTVFVIGRNSAGIWQSLSALSVSRTWVIDTTWPTVRLNELLARNVAAVSYQGGFPDLVELYNEGANPVDLSGMRLTDDAGDPGKFVFAGGTSLAGGAYLTLSANDLGFTLDQDGGGLHLFHRVSAGGARLDSVEFGLQVADRSIGRIGTSGTWVLAVPTLNGANQAQALGDERNLRINEWLASGQSPFADDFIELFNTDALPVALGGLYLTDAPIGWPTQHAIAPLTFVAAGGFGTFIADGNGGSPDRVSFGLNSDQGEIALLAANQSLIDNVIYGPQRVGVSEGRCPDGSITNKSLVLPTPGGGNACPTPPIPPTTVNLVPYNATWSYDQVNSYDGVGWMEDEFSDIDWLTGPGVLARPATGGITQPVNTLLTLGRLTYYFRTRFTVAPNSGFTGLQISHFIDDGAVVYLNGKPSYRHNMPTGDITYASLATTGISGAPSEVVGASFPITNLVVGENYLAVEVHQSDPNSSDVYMGLKLDGVIASASSGSVLINEILANNATTAEPDGSTPDWVEIYNPTTTAVNLAGLSLADGGGNRWFFPPGATINGLGYFTVRFDADKPASSTNTGFGLGASGDVVTLYNRAPQTNTPIDSRSFGLQTADFSIGRSPNGGANWTLNLPTIGSANLVASLGNVSQLRINEWLADPQAGEDDWFELYNPNAQPVDISFCYLSDSSASHRLPALSYIGAITNAWQVFIADDNSAAADHVPFRLGAGSDAIGLANSNGAPIDAVSWNIAQQVDVSEGRLPDGAATIVRFPGTGSPGDANFQSLTNVVINEVLAHTDPPLEDAIELHNPTSIPVNVAGWWLSDSRGVPQKYQIPLNTPAIPPGGFRVFYEYQFNNRDEAIVPFALSSADGDQVYLSSANAGGQMNGFRTFVDFRASANGVSFGRYRTSVGFDFTAMSARTFGVDNPVSLAQFRTGTGKTNVYPKIGAIVISEIMYHPPDITGGGMTNDNLVEEFVELRNTSSNTVPLYDPLYPTNGWRLRDGVDFRFNTSHAIPPGGHLIVVSFNPASDPAALAQFRTRYGTNYALVGPYNGRLDNGGESVELVRPDTPQPDGSVPSILVEKVVYSDRAPWPINADGLGMSLQRVSATGYANDPTNWVAAAPAPGAYGLMDTDGDGMSDAFEDLYGFQKSNPNDAALDFDLDGMTNLEEYLAGTHPKQAASTLKLLATQNGVTTELRFSAVAGRTYSIVYTDGLDAGLPWFKLADVPAPPSNQTILVPDNSAGARRFYQIVTPALP